MNAARPPAMLWSGDALPREGWQGWKSERTPSIYTVKGPENGPALLLLPGVCDPWHTFEASFPALEEHFTIYGMDWRGHGHSDSVYPGRYHVSDHIEDALAVFDSIGADRILVAGNSLGAFVAAAIAAARPETVSGAVLEDGPFFILEPARWQASHLREDVFGRLAECMGAREREGQSLDDFSRSFALLPFAFMPQGDVRQRVRWTSKFLQILENMGFSSETDAGRNLEAALVAIVGGGRATWGELFPEPIIREVAKKHMQIRSDVVRMVADPDFAAGFDHNKVLKAIRAPVLFIEADRDLSGLMSEDDVERALAALGALGSYLYLEDAVHEAHETHPEQFADAIIRFAQTRG